MYRGRFDGTGRIQSVYGSRQFSGAGGRVDYVRGAMLSQGGKSIMAMPSTAAKGTVSRIVPFWLTVQLLLPHATMSTMW